MKLATLTVLAAAFIAASASSSPPSCSADSHCPEDTPCCSAYGQCGTGSYCLGGCDARFSFAADSCAPMPVCQAGTYTFDDVKNIIYYTNYDGDISQNTWSYTGEVLEQNNSAVLTMRKDTVGTVMFSNFFIWFGKVSVVMKTSHLAGVVSDFILMSNVKDEIDYEFVGTQLETAQTNYYYQGILDYDNEKNGAVDNSTYDNYHEFTIDWNPTSITWYVDGNAVRTLQQADTMNTTTNRYEFPQTPARIQLSVWPGGASNQGEGTIQWAGGPINWNAPDLTDPGYYFVEIESVTVDCYDPPSGANVTGSKSYIYTNQDGFQQDVAITNDDTVIQGVNSSAIGPIVSQVAVETHEVASATASLAAVSEVAQSTTSAKPTTSSSNSGSSSSDGSSSGSSDPSSGAGSTTSAGATASASAASVSAGSSGAARVSEMVSLSGLLVTFVGLTSVMLFM
jgi:beta-glucanase (GH16 family)